MKAEGYTRQQVALYLGLDPFDEKTWPLETLDHLICVERNQGSIAFMRECHKMLPHPAKPKGADMSADEIAIKHFVNTQKALHTLVGLFITGPLKSHASKPEVRNAISVLAQIAKDRA